MTHTEPMKLEIELMLGMDNRMRSSEPASFVPSAGPRNSVDALCSMLNTQTEKKSWCAKARADAIIGSCARSLLSVKRGCRCYFGFCGARIRQNANAGIAADFGRVACVERHILLCEYILKLFVISESGDVVGWRLRFSVWKWCAAETQQVYPQ